MAKNKKKMNKYIATAAAAAVVVAPVAAVPTEAASVTGAAVTTDINGLAAQAAATDAFYSAVAAVRTDYNNLSATQKSKVTAATLTKLVNSEKAVQVMKDIQALVLTDTALESKAAVIRTAYTAIPLAGKLQVKNLADLVAAEEAAVANKTNAAAAAKVTTQINALGATPTALAVTNARTAYTNLTDVQKPFVTAETLAKLTNAETYISNKETSATDATTKATTYVENVGKIAAATDRNAAITTAEAGSLTAEELALLTTEKATEVTAAKKSFDNLKAAQEVVNKIDALLLTDDFAAYEAAVKEARELYANLPLAQKLLVNNLEDLVEEEKTVALGEEKAQETVNPDTVAAQKVTALIKALPAVADATAADEAAVLAASAEFNKLTDAGKALVAQELQTKLSDLLAADVFATANASAAFETKVAAIKDKTASNVLAAIATLETEYTGLDAATKQIVDNNGNYAKVLTAKAKIEAINTAVAGVVAGAEKDADSAALTALLTQKTELEALDASVQVFVRNQAVLTSKITAVTSALRTNATAELTAIAAATDHDTLGTAITTAEAAVAKYAVILGVTDFANADDASKLTVTSTLTKYVELANAKAAHEVGETIETLVAFTPDAPNFDAAIASNKEARTEYAELTVKQTPYVKNYTVLTANESAVSAAFDTLKSDANTAITALADVADATELTTAIGTATSAVKDYTEVYQLLNDGKAEADAHATLTNHGNIALAEAAVPVVEAVEGLTYAYNVGDAVVAGELTAAITAYHSAKDLVEELNKDAENPFFLNKAKFEGADKTAIETSIAKLAEDAVAEITKLSNPAPTAVDAYEGFITTAGEKVEAFELQYKAYNKVEAADFAAITNHEELEKAQAALATIKLYDALAYTAPAAVADYVEGTFTTAVTDFNTATAAFEALAPEVQTFVFNGAKATVYEQAITDTIALLIGNTTAIIADITADNAGTAAAMTTAIQAAEDAYTQYETAYKAVKGNDADASTTVNTYGNIALAKLAQPVMAAFAALVYAEEAAADYDVTKLTNAVEAYKTAKESYAELDPEAQAFVFNKADNFDAINAEFGKTLTNLDEDAEAKITAITTATTDAQAMQGAIDAATTAAGKFAAAYKLVNDTDADLATEITGYENIAAATEAIAVVNTIVTALAATDDATSTRENERLATLNAADTAYKALTTDAARGYVFNHGTLITEIEKLDTEYADRVALLDAAEDAVKLLQSNVDETKVTDLATAATTAVDAYTGSNVPDSATALETDVIGFADIALYNTAAATITKIAEIATAADKEATVAEARALYDALDSTVQAKVFNYAELTAAEGGIASTVAEAKKAAEDAIVALKTATTADELAEKLTAVDTAINAYKALNTTFSEYDLAGIEEVEYANEATPIVNQIASLTADSTKEVVEAVRAEYEAVSEKIQAYVVNLSALETLEQAIEDKEEAAVEEEQNQQNEAAVNDFETKFGAIAAANGAGFEAAVTAADSAYTALTPDQKVAAAGKIENVVVKLANYTAALPVVKNILAIGDLSALTSADITALEAKVTPARTNYTALALAAKLLVVNLSDLTAAEQKLATLKTEKAAEDKVNTDQAIADVVISQIAALEGMDIDSAAYVKAVKDARAAYKALALKHKLLVTNLAKLVEHEQNI